MRLRSLLLYGVFRSVVAKKTRNSPVAAVGRSLCVQDGPVRDDLSMQHGARSVCHGFGTARYGAHIADMLAPRLSA